MKVTNLRDIKANIKTNWTNKNCKFKPGAMVKVTDPAHWASGPVHLRTGWVAKVRAVSCAADGTIRGRGVNARMFTRYYVQFADDRILGIDSNSLTHA